MDPGEPGTLLWHFERLYLPQRLLGGCRGYRDQHRHTIRLFGEFLGRPALPNDLTDENVAAYLAWYSERSTHYGELPSPVTVNCARKRLVALWGYLARKRIVEHFPEVTPMPEFHKNPTAWTQDQLAALWSSCLEEPGEICGIPACKWWFALHALLYDTAARIAPVLAADYHQYDAHAGTFLARAEHQKHRRDEVWGLHPQTVAALNGILQPVRELLFPFPRTKAVLYRRLGGILARAGLPTDRRSKFHKIRRTSATMAELHVGPGAGSRHLGHTNPRLAELHYLDATMLPAAKLAMSLPRPVLPRVEGGAA